MMNRGQLAELLREAIEEQGATTKVEKKVVDKLLSEDGDLVNRLYSALAREASERVIRAPVLAGELLNLFSSTTTAASRAAERLCDLYTVLPKFPKIRNVHRPHQGRRSRKK